MAISVLSPLLFVAVFALPFLQLGSSDPIHHVQSFRVETLLPNPICMPFKGSGSIHGKSVAQVVSRFGPCSPFTGASTDRNFTQQLHHDSARTRWIHSRMLLDTSNSTTLPATAGIPLGSMEFIVKIGLGTPKEDFLVLFDTGSDVTWVQCEPCPSSCHSQEGPRFDPSASATFQYFPCNATQCRELGKEGNVAVCDASVRCTYQVRYVDGSESSGHFGRDTLTLTSSDVFGNFPFGCGTHQVGDFGRVAGLLGLGRNKLSLVSTTAKYHDSVFSYCLPSSSSTGFLTFGPDSGSESASFTRLLTNPQVATFYLLSLVAISVGGKPINMSSSEGMILDSGTAMTRLPYPVYAALKSAFHSHMSAYSSVPGTHGLDTCYDFSGHTSVLIPRVTFHFVGGTDLELQADAIMIILSISEVCLAFVPQAQTGILGSWQQRRTLIIHDLARSRIGFVPKACS
ncbi:aspartyl protease family protein At5g10770-like [Nymphaea colorata]|nr:aspartyl protease family protein At5g10770-like [Nymphaea colorata]